MAIRLSWFCLSFRIFTFIEFKDEITGITRDCPENVTTSISEASYPKAEFTFKMEKDELNRCGLHDEGNTKG